VIGAYRDDDNGPDSGPAYVFAYADCNANTVPDECEPLSVLMDLDGDTDVDVSDFLTFANCFNGALNPPACP